jgi:hypothetical protein
VCQTDGTLLVNWSFCTTSADLHLLCHEHFVKQETTFIQQKLRDGLTKRDARFRCVELAESGGKLICDLVRGDPQWIRIHMSVTGRRFHIAMT